MCLAGNYQLHLCHHGMGGRYSQPKKSPSLRNNVRGQGFSNFRLPGACPVLHGHT